MPQSLSPYEVQDSQALSTPSLLIYADMLESNISAALQMMNGDASRWRPHLKTAKLGYTMRRLVARGVKTGQVRNHLGTGGGHRVRDGGCAGRLSAHGSQCGARAADRGIPSGAADLHAARKRRSNRRVAGERGRRVRRSQSGDGSDRDGGGSLRGSSRSNRSDSESWTALLRLASLRWTDQEYRSIRGSGGSRGLLAAGGADRASQALGDRGDRK